MAGLRKALIAIGLAGAFLGAFTAYAILTSDHVDRRGVETVLALTIGWGFVGAGVIAWWRRPENNFGPLMTATGFLFFVSELAASNIPWVLAVAGLLGNLFLGVVFHMLLAMPSGRLQSGFERGLVGVGNPRRNSARTTGLNTYFAVPLASLRFVSRRLCTRSQPIAPRAAMAHRRQPGSGSGLRFPIAGAPGSRTGRARYPGESSATTSCADRSLAAPEFRLAAVRVNLSGERGCSRLCRSAREA